MILAPYGSSTCDHTSAVRPGVCGACPVGGGEFQQQSLSLSWGGSSTIDISAISTSSNSRIFVAILGGREAQGLKVPADTRGMVGVGVGVSHPMMVLGSQWPVLLLQPAGRGPTQQSWMKIEARLVRRLSWALLWLRGWQYGITKVRRQGLNACKEAVKGTALSAPV